MTVACGSSAHGGRESSTLGGGNAAALRLVGLPPLMERTAGSADVVIGLIDGPVVLDHPDLPGDNMREVPGARAAACGRTDSAACVHGTAVAGILGARRGSSAPAVSPGCTLLIRPIFVDSAPGKEVASATPEELASAILDCLQAGARVLNVSSALVEPAFGGDRRVQEALDRAAVLGAVVVAAAGNQASIGRSAITGHPAVLPVVACDAKGRVLGQSNLGSSIGRRGLSAPGDEILTLGTDGRLSRLSGTSAAAPFVTGTIALLMSTSYASAVQARSAVTQAGRGRRTSVVPPLLDAAAAYEALRRTPTAERRAYR